MWCASQRWRGGRRGGGRGECGEFEETCWPIDDFCSVSRSCSCKLLEGWVFDAVGCLRERGVDRRVNRGSRGHVVIKLYAMSLAVFFALISNRSDRLSYNCKHDEGLNLDIKSVSQSNLVIRPNPAVHSSQLWYHHVTRYHFSKSFSPIRQLTRSTSELLPHCRNTCAGASSQELELFI
jgi:hypothetical protein